MASDSVLAELQQQLADLPAQDDLEQLLARLQKRLHRAARRKDKARYGDLRQQIARVKADLVRVQHVGQRAQQLAARRARRAVEAQQQPELPERWRLPFRKSPGAIARDRQPAPAELPQIPNGGRGLRPWRRGWHPAAEQIWRPGG